MIPFLIAYLLKHSDRSLLYKTILIHLRRKTNNIYHEKCIYKCIIIGTAALHLQPSIKKNHSKVTEPPHENFAAPFRPMSLMEIFREYFHSSLN